MAKAHDLAHDSKTSALVSHSPSCAQYEHNLSSSTNSGGEYDVLFDSEVLLVFLSVFADFIKGNKRKARKQKDILN
jgi:hypothetical protein